MNQRRGSLTKNDGTPALHRLNALAPLDDAAIMALEIAFQRARIISQRRELTPDSINTREPILVLDGWAARLRTLADGRRQILNFILPGDLIGLYGYDQASTATTITAFTPVTFCPAPNMSLSPALELAYAASRALEEAHVLAQITRIGRLNAHERIADLMLELLERLSLAGLANGNEFTMPLTQEILADALGLTSVHINRTLQLARREGELEISGKSVRICDPESLYRSIGRHHPAID